MQQLRGRGVLFVISFYINSGDIRDIPPPFNPPNLVVVVAYRRPQLALLKTIVRSKREEPKCGDDYLEENLLGENGSCHRYLPSQMYVLYTAYSISTELHNLRTNLNLVFKSSFLYNNNMWAVFYNESLVMSSEHWACFFAEEVKRKHFSH